MTSSSRFCSFVLAALLLVGGAAPAVAEGGVTLSNVRVDGVQRLEPSTVISYLTLTSGDEATPEALSSSLKALFATGLFSDVTLTVDGSVLVVSVAENPIINSVSYEGTDTISEEDLEKEVQVKPRLVYTLPRVQKDVERILELYRRSGRFAATVDPVVTERDQNRVDITFKINEGAHTGVRRIQFIGNEAFDEGTLGAQINSQETAWWKFFSTSDFYDPDRVSYDRELLRRFYMNEGYVDFRVVSSVAEMTPDREDFFLTFTVEEGPRYKFGSIDAQSEIKGFDAETVRSMLLTEPGAWYSAEAVEKTVTKLTAYLGDRQYAFVEILPEVKKNKETQVVDLVYHIKPGQRVHIGRIDITGNTRTLDKVVRREMLVAEGDPYNGSRIKRSEQKIKDLGFFESVKVSPVAGEQADRSDLNVVVTEKPTGEVSLGAGFSSTDGPLGDFSIRERNFLGRGQDVRLGATVSGVTKQFDFSFTEPAFLDRDLSAGADIFHVRTDQQDESNYDTVNTGFSFRLGYPLSEALRQTLSYTLRQDKIGNVPSTASRFIRDQEGTTSSSIFSQELVYDKRDSRLDPTEGFVTRLKTDITGLGGERRYYRVRLSGAQYYTLAEDVVLSASAEGGFMDGFDQKVRINDRFFLGGDTMRGFAYAGIGPRDLTRGADDALGGTQFARGSVEVSFPTFLPKDVGIKGHAFIDAATLSESGETPLATEIFRDEEALRASAGLGLSWASPFGPVRLDYAVPFMKRSYDKTEHIHFSFGTRF